MALVFHPKAFLYYLKGFSYKKIFISLFEKDKNGKALCMNENISLSCPIKKVSWGVNFIYGYLEG